MTEIDIVARERQRCLLLVSAARAGLRTTATTPTAVVHELLAELFLDIARGVQFLPQTEG